MNKPFFRDLLTGITTLAGLVGLVVMLWLFGELKDVGNKYYEFTVRLNAATGLTNTSPVALNGVRVGSVMAISLADDPTRGAVLRLKIKEGTKIPENFTVYLDRGFVGETSVQLEFPSNPDGSVHAAALVPTDGNATYDRHAMTLFESLSAPLKDPLARLAKAADGFEKLATTYDEVGKKVIEALEPRSPADVDAGKPANLLSTIARIDQAVAGANQWLADPSMRDQAKGVVAKADLLLDKAQETADALRKTALSADEQIARVGGKVAETADQAGVALRKVGDAADEVTKLSASAGSGEGTVGQLMKNPDLYNSVKDAAARLERVLVELQVLLEKYRKEGIPIQF